MKWLGERTDLEEFLFINHTALEEKEKKKSTPVTKVTSLQTGGDKCKNSNMHKQQRSLINSARVRLYKCVCLCVIKDRECASACGSHLYSSSSSLPFLLLNFSLDLPRSLVQIFLLFHFFTDPHPPHHTPYNVFPLPHL